MKTFTFNSSRMSGTSTTCIVISPCYASSPIDRQRDAQTDRLFHLSLYRDYEDHLKELHSDVCFNLFLNNTAPVAGLCLRVVVCKNGFSMHLCMFHPREGVDKGQCNPQVQLITPPC